jgi:hypothetical protein
MIVIAFLFISKLVQNKFVVFIAGKSVINTLKIILFKQSSSSFLQSLSNPL